MRFGHFDDKSREYVITRPDTPLPWINYLGRTHFLDLFQIQPGATLFIKMPA